MDRKALRVEYEKNPTGFLLLEVIRQGSQPIDMVVQYVNPAAAALLGRKAEEMMGQSYYQLFEHTDSKWMQGYDQIAYHGKRQTFYYDEERTKKRILVDCFQFEPGFCGCILQNAEQVYEPQAPSQSKPKSERLSREETEISALLQRYAVPLSEVYFLRSQEDFVYLADPNTYEMLFISAPNPEELLPNGKDYQFKKCYEVLQNRTEPCPYCTNHLLRFDQYYIWQHQNEVTGREYLLRDKLTHWNGRLARMEVVMDVTDGQKKIQLLAEGMESNGLLLRCSSILRDSLPMQEALQQILENVGEYYQADYGVGVLFDHPHICTTWSKQGNYQVNPAIIGPSQAAIEKWGLLLRGKNKVMIPNVEQLDASMRIKQHWEKQGIQSIALTPVVVDGKLRGFLALYNISQNLVQIAMLDAIVSEIVATVRNLTLIEENKRLQFCDTLTGHLNFEGFKQWAVQILRQSEAPNYAIWYCDIKRFKYINEAFGYETGDQLLCDWANIIQRDLGENEVFGRVSGDNFVLLTHYSQREELEERFQRMSQSVQGCLEQKSRRFDVEIMAGIYLIQEEERKKLDINQLLDWANIAQKSIKKLSGSHLAFFDEKLWQQQRRELEISQHMHSGIEAGEFRVWLQPQYDYESGRLLGAEALVRWTHPALGPILPGEFIPILERDGQITELDLYVWKEACRYMRRWLDTKGKLFPVAVSINVSRMDIRNMDLCETLCGLVDTYGLPRKMLRIEITESAYMEEPEQLIDVVARLRKSGFTVEMDDFGSGYSSLNMLKDVPVDILKLDMRFLQGADNTFREGNILSSVLRMAHWLEMPVIAEGVETKEQADYLKSLGCYLMQGYYFARPMPVEEFEKLLLETKREDIGQKYQNIEFINMKEFLDTKSKSSFIFNCCIGGAGLMEFDGGNMEALMLNDAFYETIGISRAEYDPYRTHMLDAVEPLDQPAAFQAVRKAVEAGEESCELRIRDSARWIRVHFRHLSSSAGRHTIFALLTDITQEHAMRAELDEVTTELRSYLDLMPGGVFRYAVDGDDEFGYVSQGLLDMLGYTKQEFQAKFHNRFSEMVYCGDRERVLREIAEQIEVGDTDYCEYRIEVADGSLRWVFDAGRVVTDAQGKRWFYVVVTDIEDQKQTENKQVFETFGKAMAAMFDEVSDLNYQKDTMMILHTQNQAIGNTPIHGLDHFLSLAPGQWKLSGKAKDEWLSLICRENVRQTYHSHKVSTIELKTDRDNWYKILLLPLSEERGLVCASNITLQKQAEQLRMETAGWEAIQDLFSKLPVGTCVFIVEPSGGRQLRFMSQTVCRIFNMTQEELEAAFAGALPEEYWPYPKKPEELEALLLTGAVYQKRITVKIHGADCLANVLTKLERQPNGRIVGYAAVLDISSENQEEKWRQTLSRILEKLPQMIVFDYDPVQDQLMHCRNIAVHEMAMVAPNYLQKLDQRKQLAPESVSILRKAFQGALQSPQSGSVDFRANYFGDTYRWARAYFVSLADESGAVTRIVGRIDDIDEEKRKVQTLKALADSDAMTGFLNHDASKDSIAEAIRTQGGGALLIMDIDDFKQVNDALGHLFGDRFLKTAADTLRDLFRREDILGRFGGDEFIVFLPGVHSEQLAERRARDVIDGFNQIRVPELGTVRCSIGIAITDTSDMKMEELFKQADFALYQAKRNGKGSYALYRGDRQIERMPEVQAPRRPALSQSSEVHSKILAGDVFSILYHSDATEEGIQEALAHIGRWLDVSRVYIFENSEDNRFFDNTFEWCDDGISPEIANLQHIERIAAGADYYDNFNQDDIFYCSDVQELPSWQKNLLEGQRIRSMLQWAFRKEGKICGMIGFDECRENRLWVKGQIDCLIRAAEVIAVFLQRLRG